MKQGNPNVQLTSPSSTSTSPGRPLKAQAIKLLCTTGGRFGPDLENTHGSKLRYLGGQTRLVTLSPSSTYSDLVALVGRQWRANGGVHLTEDEACRHLPIIKYHLPSQPDVMVDVVDSGDLSHMLEEHAELAGHAARPRIFVEWRQAADGAMCSWKGGGLGGGHVSEQNGRSLDNSLSSSGGSLNCDAFKTAPSPPGSPLPSLLLQALGSSPAAPAPVAADPPKAKLQVIPSSVVQLVTILGTGTFGDTFRGVWHHTDVAVKCWSRGMLGMQCALQQQDWGRFAAAANQLASLRHPNLVQMYGILLPDAQEQQAAQQAAQQAQQREGATPGGGDCRGGGASWQQDPPQPDIHQQAQRAHELLATDGQTQQAQQAQQRQHGDNTHVREEGRLFWSGGEGDGVAHCESPALPRSSLLTPADQAHPSSIPPPPPPAAHPACAAPSAPSPSNRPPAQAPGAAPSPPSPSPRPPSSPSSPAPRPPIPPPAQPSPPPSPPQPPKQHHQQRRRPSWSPSSQLSLLPQESGSSDGRAPPPIPLHTPALVMEYIPGLSLQHLIDSGRELSTSACYLNARDVAKAMEYLHSRGIIHLDLKSGNVLLSWDGPKPSAKVTAWGMLRYKLAAAFSPGMALRRSWWPWMAPELFHNPALISEKADVYSFGIILWELWAHRRPYQHEQGGGMAQLLGTSFQASHARPQLPGSCPGLPARPEPAPGWRHLMERCWAEAPSHRPSFREVLRELHGMGRELKERSRRRRRAQHAQQA